MITGELPGPESNHWHSGWQATRNWPRLLSTCKDWGATSVLRLGVRLPSRVTVIWLETSSWHSEAWDQFLRLRLDCGLWKKVIRSCPNRNHPSLEKHCHWQVKKGVLRVISKDDQIEWTWSRISSEPGDDLPWLSGHLQLTRRKNPSCKTHALAFYCQTVPVTARPGGGFKNFKFKVGIMPVWRGRNHKPFNSNQWSVPIPWDHCAAGSQCFDFIFLFVACE